MSRTLHLAMVACLLQAGPLLGGEPMKPTLDIKDMRVIVSYVSTGEIVKLQADFGAHIDRRDVRQDYRHGFSILKTNRETGARTCDYHR